ncbi:MAG TPA: hypothetical protein VNJ08_04260 [Bacteriovoracaceae bacterium]|nr:hypothetical protein [Bacteriovoracaceae bacterium]
MKTQFFAIMTLMILSTSCKVGFNFKNGFGYTTIKGGGTFSSVLNLTGTNMPISGEMFKTNTDIKIAESIVLYDLRIKGFKPAQVPTNKEASQDLVNNEDTYKSCSGAPDMSWLASADIFIVNNRTGARQMIATWSKSINDQDNLDCVLTFDAQDGVNIKDFMPDFSVELEASGRQPQTDTLLGGIIGVDVGL